MILTAVGDIITAASTPRAGGELARLSEEANERGERLALEMAEFERELPTLLLQQDREARDPYGNRWVLCSSCGLIAQDSEFSSYGGIGSVNLGICRECMKTNADCLLT